MNGKTKNLLIVAMEECSEIIQACSKAIRFGLDAHHPNKDKSVTHASEILVEYYQLQAIIEKLQKDGNMPYFNSDFIKRIKRGKLRKMEKYYEENKNKR